MNVTSHSSLDTRAKPGTEVELRVSAYDRVASTLIALLVVIGVAVLLLFTVWLTARVVFDKPLAKFDKFVYGDEHPDAMGLDGELDEPGADDLQELSQPPIETTLIAITDVVTNQAAMLDAVEQDAEGSAGGLLKGDRRRRGTVPAWPPDVIPPWQRWEIRFTTSDIAMYARQLDFFGIELGTVGGGSSEVHYARNLAKPAPDCRQGDPQAEERMYMTWREGGGAMAALDRQLLARAGLATEGRVVAQFYPQDVEQQLLRLEMLEAGQRQPREFLKTVFGVRSAGGGYEFYVVEQTFRLGSTTH